LKLKIVQYVETITMQKLLVFVLDIAFQLHFRDRKEEFSQLFWVESRPT